ncbi:Ig-like, group 2 [Moorella thermoacetica]|uniref:Ig-like, group 2 n=2 Tax=Neomoorella thermoacetica TaxID=1525 RepID=Q2RLW2_MOOTA|nr:bacterial Ig-like domain (group 2) [Moorella thermoacetica]AKX95624.1 bacterial Ig-like domain (group 2) [Moorella thermoacetica]OIQ53665.1 bacterial Ig-like domain protein [Moorella thermoacetica]QCZ99433.1 Bacterial Ig-like domain (group 2) [Moorella thermoacetica]TYL07701.1 hypothetical protein MOOCA_20470 [Moorella thermoacetica]
MFSRMFALKKPAGAFGLLLALILIFGLPGYALAVPAQPHQFYGQVTVGGEPAPQGIEVVAKIDGVQYAATVTDALGRYGYDPVFYVPADNPDTPAIEGGRRGDLIEFYVAGVLAGSYQFEVGGVTKLDLSIAALPDTTAPTVSITDPANNATSVAVDKTITVTFSEDVKAGAAYDGITLKDAGGYPVAVTRNIVGKVLTIKPNANLTNSTTYTVVIPAGAVADLAGKALAQDYIFNFTTEAAPVTLQALKVEPSSFTLTVGETKQLVVKAVYSDGSEADVTDEATYASANENVARISATGLITAASAGETVITATYGDKEAQVAVIVQVSPAGPAPTVTAVDPTNAVAGQSGQTITVTGQNFQDGAQVVLLQNGQEVSAVNAVYSDSSRVTFTLPVSVPPGVYTVAVRNPDGQQSADAVALVLYAGPKPAMNVYPGVQGTQPGQVQAGGGVRVEVPVLVSQIYPNALVIIRVDDPDGKPLYASVEGPLPANTPLKYSASFNLPGKAGNYTVKAYVWDGWQTMNPIVPASQAQFTAQ